jgi:hypothetical protein
MSTHDRPVQAWMRRRERAQGIWDTVDRLTTVRAPADYRSRSASIRAGYEALNNKAKGNTLWDAAYQQDVAADKEIQGRSWWQFGDQTWHELDRRERELAAWQEKLAATGIDVGPRRQLDAPTDWSTPLTDALSSLTTVALVGGAVYVVAKLLK